MGGPIFPFHRLGVDAPIRGGPAAHLANRLTRGLHRRLAAGKGRPAAMGGFINAQRASFHHVHPDVFIRNAQELGHHQPDRGPAAANIGRADGHGCCPILAHRQRHRGFAPMVEPKARGDAPPLVRAQRNLVVRMRLGRLQRFLQADDIVIRPIAGLGPVARAVLQPHLDRVQLQLATHLINKAFHRKGRHWGTRCTIGRRLGPVRDDLNTLVLQGWNVIAGKGARQRFANR